VNVAVIDVGSNTVRLLVASVEDTSVVQLRRERYYLRLGDDVHGLGRISREKLSEAGNVARRFARLARKTGAEQLKTIVTAPGRQALNGTELVRLFEHETGAVVVQLTGDDEGRLAWEGAVARMDRIADSVAVIDLGGGSCELAVGTPGLEPAWLRSVDAGALRITRTHFGARPTTAEQIAAARYQIRHLIATFDPPRPDVALVAGGTARAVGRVIGPTFDAEQLEGLAATLERLAPESIVASHGVTPERAQTLLGGTLVLAELAYRLETTLEVARGGLREGAAIVLARAVLAAA